MIEEGLRDLGLGVEGAALGEVGLAHHEPGASLCECGKSHIRAECPRSRPPAVEGGFRTFRLKSCFTCRVVPAEKLCKACGAMSYCSAECQMADWRRHKKECKMFSDDGWKKRLRGMRAMLVAREGSAGQRLLWASSLGSVFAVRSLLAEGVDVNFVD